MSDDESAKLVKAVAWALHEVRVLLGPGRTPGLPPNVDQAARLAYGLHNEALSLFANGKCVDLEHILRRVEAIDVDFGSDMLKRLKLALGDGGQDQTA